MTLRSTPRVISQGTSFVGSRAFKTKYHMCLQKTPMNFPHACNDMISRLINPSISFRELIYQRATYVHGVLCSHAYDEHRIPCMLPSHRAPIACRVPTIRVTSSGKDDVPTRTHLDNWSVPRNPPPQIL